MKTPILAIADRVYSSWSLRGWLSFARFNVPVDVQHYELFTPSFDAMQQTTFAPTQRVPAVKFDDETICWDSLAILEELNERYKQINFWPEDPRARAFCRSMVAEMHSGFLALRSECPMNLRYLYSDFNPTGDLVKECERIDYLWSTARTTFGADGPWLFGNHYTAADVFFAPVATRFATYNLPRSETSEDYIQSHLQDTSLRQWRAMGLANFRPIDICEYPELTTQPWPITSMQSASKADSVAEAVNELCPYSNEPVTHGLEMDGIVYGFCNEFCRDKTVYDPEAFPKFQAIVKQ